MEVVEDCGSEVENRRRRAEERCEELELEIVKRESEYEALEVKFRDLEGEKLAMEEEIRQLKRGSDETREQVNEDNLEEEDTFFQLMLENKVLEFEKKTAETEVEAWKQKFKELKTWVLKLDNDLVLKGGEFPWKLTGDSVEVEAWKQKSKELESWVLKLECEKKNAEAEVEAWEQKSKELESWVLNLECEKKNAETEVEAWKQKFKELESWVLKSECEKKNAETEVEAWKLKSECEKKNAETEVEAWKQKFEELESWVLKLEFEKKNAETEVEAWKPKFKELESWVLKLECEKKNAEAEVEAWEQKSKELESWVLNLGCGKKNAEIEVEAWKQKSKELESWVLKLECEKKNAETEVEAWKQKFKELESWVLKLECEKKNAETEVEAWKQKFKELESWVLKLEREKKNAETEVEAWKQKSKELESWVLKLEREKKNAETEVEAWKQKSKELESWVLKLECEKKNAETEDEAWKKKFKDLEMWVLKLDKDKVLKGGEFPLQLTGDSVEASSRTQASARIELEEGLKVGVGMESSRSKEMAVNVIDLSSTYHSPGTPPNVTFYEHHNGTKEEKRSGNEYGNVSQARKQLEFKEDRSPCKKMAPPTPGGCRPFSLSVIDISDSDDEVTIVDNQKILPIENQGSRKICISTDSAIGGLATKSFLKPAHTDSNDQEDVDNYNEELLAFSTPKRKRAYNVVTSDSESSDDNLPISIVKRIHLQERINDEVGSDLNGSLETAAASVADDVSVSSPKRHLVRLRKCGRRGRVQRNSSQTNETKNVQGSNKDIEEDEPEEVGSESEGESLGGFIVNSSGVSESDDASSVSNNVSDDDVNFEEVLSTFQRNKDHNTKWEFEADMLAAFGKDPELCMKAVCALYRQQTSGEKISRGTLCSNSRGFSKFDACRGSKLADFLTDGDPSGDLNKTVEELEERDPKAIETCRTFATRYSKQLFDIYRNKEDPLFLPS